MKQKVVLYNPDAVFFDMPLALMAIGSMLDPSRFDVTIIDARVTDNAHASLVNACNGALLLGVTSLTGAPIKDALSATRQVKAAYPRLPVVWGGWHTSLFPEATLHDEPAIDVTVQAQGEITFRELVNAFADANPLDEIRGICFRKNGRVIKNPARPLADMNELAPVNYGLIDVEDYFARKGRRQIDYISSTGCPFRCAFCADPAVFARKYTALEPERVAVELKTLIDRTGATDINFQDETFFTYRKRVRGIAEQFNSLGIEASWAATMRADQAHRLTDEDFTKLKHAGLRRVLIGVESGTQEMLDWLAKDITIEQVMESAERCRRHNIDAIFPFIVGFPGETNESVLASLDLARRLRALSPNFTTPIFYFKPYPGSKIASDVVSVGYSLPRSIEEWAEFDYIGSSGPWVSDEKRRLVEGFKFFNDLAGRGGSWLLRPLIQLAKWRTRHHRYEMPLEKQAIEWLRPSKQLS